MARSLQHRRAAWVHDFRQYLRLYYKAMSADPQARLPQEALQRIVDVVLLSRIPLIGEYRSRNRQRVSLLLDIGSVDCVGDVLKSYWKHSHGNPTLRLDIFRYRRDTGPSTQGPPVSSCAQNRASPPPTHATHRIASHA